MLLAIDENGVQEYISNTDERYLSGELVSYFKGENNGMYGKTHTEEAIQKIKQARAVQGSNVWNAGKTDCYTEETKKQIAETLTGRIFVNKDGVNVNIYPEELDYYLSIGYNRGHGKRNKENKIRVFSDDNQTGILIEKNELEHYLNLGYYKKKLIYVTKDNSVLMINPDELEKYLADGWLRGMKIQRKSGTLGTKAMTDPETNKTKYVSPDEFDKYLELGFTFNKAKLK